MSTLPSLGNPFVYAQFRLNGGWKGAFTIGGVYAAALVGLIMMTAVVGAGGSASPVAFWPQILLALQMLALFVVGLARVNAAIRGDLNTRMIESHRLMPVHPLSAVVGYVAGGSIFGLILAGINLVLGVACAAAGGGDVWGFLLGNAALGLSAVLVLFVAAHLAFTSRFGLLLLIAVGGAAFGLGNEESRVVPGLGLLTAAVTGPLQPHNAGGTNAYAVALVAQLLIAAVCCRAAMRLYRSADAIGTTAPLGLGLLGVWTGLSVIALGFPRLVYPRDHHWAADVPSQVVGTTVVGMLVATVPVAAACRAARARNVPPLLVPLVVAAAVSVAPWLARHVRRHNPRPVLPAAGPAAAVDGLTFVVVAAYVAALTLVMHWAYRRRLPGWPLAFLWLIATWVGPLIAAVAAQAMSAQPHDDVEPGGIFSLSPVGALVTLWSRTAADRPLGPILAQVILVAFPALVYVSTSRSRQPAAPAATA